MLYVLLCPSALTLFFAGYLTLPGCLPSAMSARFLLRLFTLVLGSFYLGSVCELNAAECRQNYAKETHEYVAARPGVEVSAPAAHPDDVPAVQWRPAAGPKPCPAFRGLAGKPASWPWVANPPPPPRRLYLRYAVLQV